MNGHTEIVPKNSARFLYFLNVVAVCNRRWGTPVYGYEYVFRLHTMFVSSLPFCATDSHRPVDTSQPRFWQPGIFFKYDLQPYVMNYGVEERSFPETALRCVATGAYLASHCASTDIMYSGRYLCGGRVGLLLHTLHTKSPQADQEVSNVGWRAPWH